MTTAAPARAPGCSQLWEQHTLPAWGTASRASFWIALEVTGPWGHAATVESDLDTEIGRQLTALCDDHGGRLLLVRTPGERADPSTPGHRAWVAGRLERDPWLLEGHLGHAAELLALPWASLPTAAADSVGVMLPVLKETPEPLVLICTNGRRDVCCAVRGRSAALAARERIGDRVLECTHIGGHRFAPTGLVLPSGQMWARLTGKRAELAIAAERRGEIPAELVGAAHDRGRSCLSPAAQVAQSWVRAHTGELAHAALHTPPDAGEGVVPVEHTDGRNWRVEVTRVEGPTLPDACARFALPAVTWQATPA